MWIANGNDLIMAEGDYGVALPFTFKGMTFGASDCVAFVFKKSMNGTDILTKVFSNIQNSTVNLEFTEAESALFPKGQYIYRVDSYQNGNYKNNLIKLASLKVDDIA